MTSKSKMAKTRSTLAHDESLMDHFNCAECGEIKTVLLDAYAVFDRMGEGVMFEVSLGPDGEVFVVPDADALKYLRSIRANVTEWIQEMVKYAMDIMEDGMEFTCPKCHGDIYYGSY